MGAGLNHRGQRGRDIVHGLNQNGTFPDEVVAAMATRIEWGTWNREDLAALIERTPCRDQ